MAKILLPVPAYDGSWVITAVVPNPKRPETDCWYRYGAAKVGLTVGAFAAAYGKGYRAELAWNTSRGYVTLEAPASASARAPVFDVEAAVASIEAVIEAASVEPAVDAVEAEAVEVEAVRRRGRG